MRLAGGYVLGFALAFGITLGAPIALSGVDAPAATPVLALFVDDAAAQLDAEDCSIAILCATSESERGGNGHGGFAILHDRIITTATSDTSQSLSDVQTGDIHNEVTILVEDTDETVVINMAGNPGSTGVHMMNVGGPAQPVNTGGITSSADASGEGGESHSNADLRAEITDAAFDLDVVNVVD